MIPYAGAPVRHRRAPMSPPPGWQFIGPYLVPVPRRILMEEIKEKVAAYYYLPIREMTSARRGRDIARPRQVAMYLARHLTPKSLPQIGQSFGGRDHTTVIHAIRTIANLRLDDAELEIAIRRLTAQLEGLA
jgi:chromosomal replication initiator protein